MFDLVITGGEVIDGTGAARWHADVGITAGRIVAVGALAGQAAHRTLDASGCIVAPGFIDSHTHDDRLLLQHPARHPKLLQGVTTVVTGNCGISLAPLQCEAAQLPPPLDLLGGPFEYATFSSYVAAVQAAQPAVNAALLVGHTTLRAAAMQDLSLPANAQEVRHMQAALAQALQAGAIGLSTGVYYPPARAATTQELIDVGQPLRGGKGIVTMHLRDEADHIDAALQEAFAVGRALGAPLVLSHHKLVGLHNHGRSAHTLSLVAAAAKTQPVCLDCYPYTASSTMLLPERVATARDVQITWSQPEPNTAGRLLSELATERGITPQLLAQKLSPGGAIYFAMSDVDVDRILAHPLTMVGSDGLAPHHPAEGGQTGQPHPRLWGTFPRVLGHYARDRKLLSLESAVHKMTGLTARRFGLPGRGLLQVGAAADVTVFDPHTVQDRATYSHPTAAPTGLAWVIVNGQVVVDHGQGTGVRAGQLLLRRSL
jgi:N-acyl-D-amino-acid deacylase